MAKIGRPTNNPKELKLQIRIDFETSQKLEEICEKTKKSKAEIVRKGIIDQYEKKDNNSQN